MSQKNTETGRTENEKEKSKRWQPLRITKEQKKKENQRGAKKKGFPSNTRDVIKKKRGPGKGNSTV